MAAPDEIARRIELHRDPGHRARERHAHVLEESSCMYPSPTFNVSDSL